MRLAGGSPQADLRGSPRGQPLRRVPNRNPLQTQGLPTSRITTREAPHNQNYDQGGSPQAELQPGSLPTSRITTRELAGWLAGRITTREPVVRLAGWLAGWGGGWLAEAQRGSERGGTWIEQACHALGWKLLTSRFTNREAPHRFLYGTREEAPADFH